MRTYDRETFHGATRAWRDYGPEWDDLQAIAWDRGYPYPPAGSAVDDREDPSQRAIIYAALGDRPAGTLRIAETSSSWSQVVSRIIGVEAELRQKAEASEQALEVEKAQWVSREEAAALVQRIGPR